jgi:hypothetical protein
MIYKRTPSWMILGYIVGVTLLIIGLILIFSSGQETAGKTVLGFGTIMLVLIYWTNSINPY